MVVTVATREIFLECPVLRSTRRVQPQEVANGQQVGDLWVVDGAHVDLMASHARRVLAEIEATRSPGNLGIQTLATDPIAEALHRRAEAINRVSLAQHDQDVHDGLRRKRGHGGATNVMHRQERLAEDALEGGGLATRRRASGEVDRVLRPSYQRKASATSARAGLAEDSRGASAINGRAEC